MKHLFFSLLLCAVLFSCKKQIKSETEESTSFEKLRPTLGIMPTLFSPTSKSNPAGDGGIHHSGGSPESIFLAAPSNGSIYSTHFTRPTSPYVWNQFTNGQALDIAVADIGCVPKAPFVVGPDNKIWTTSTPCSPAYSTSWTAGNGSITRLAINSNSGTLLNSTTYPFICWAVGIDDAVYYSGWGTDVSGWYYTQWYALSGNGEVIDIDADGDNIYVIGLDHKIYYRSGSSWVEFSGSGAAKRIAVDDGKHIVWVIGTNNRVYHRSGSAWVEHPGNAQAIDISVTVSYGWPVIIGTNGLVYEANAAGWTQVN